MKRVGFSEREQLVIWKRDAWHCRYCLHPVFFAPTLQLLDQLNSGHGYYHPNGKHSSMLPLFAQKWSSVDHIVPVALGGRNDPENLATSCMDCNILKNDNPDEYKPNLIPVEARSHDWDGFALLYLKLSNASDGWTRAIRSVYEIS